MRAVIGRPAVVRFRFEDDSGKITAVDSSTTVNVTVTDGAGAQLITGSATRDLASGLYVFTVPTSVMTKFDVLTATAVGTLSGAAVTLVEPVRLVSTRLVPLATLRAQSDLSDLSTADFLRTVDEAEDTLTNLLNYSPVITGGRFTFRARTQLGGVMAPGVYYPVSCYSLTYNDAAFDSVRLASLAVRGHQFEYQTSYFGASYDPLLGMAIGGGAAFLPGVYGMHCSYGVPTVPADLARACRALTKYMAKTTTYPERATRIMTEASEIWISTPDGDKRLTGLPEVDGVILRYRINLPFADDVAAI